MKITDVTTAGIDLDWERLARHPYEPEHVLHLFTAGWERRHETVPLTDV